MNKKLDCIAFHEAGHAVAHILTGIPFKYVTIKEDSEKDEHGQRSLGQMILNDPPTSNEWEKFSLLNPNEFNIFFKDDFTKLAGLVAEGIYCRRFNYKAAKGDFRQWVGTSLNQLSESLESKYIGFMIEYTYRVLQSKNNWSNITAVALALVDEDTLSYQRVLEVIEKNRVAPYLNSIFNSNL